MHCTHEAQKHKVFLSERLLYESKKSNTTTKSSIRFKSTTNRLIGPISLIFELYFFLHSYLRTYFFLKQCTLAAKIINHTSGCVSKGKLQIAWFGLRVEGWNCCPDHLKDKCKRFMWKGGEDWAQVAAWEMLIRLKEILFHWEESQSNRFLRQVVKTQVLAGIQNSVRQGSELINSH